MTTPNDTVILKDIVLNLDLAEIAKHMRLREGNSHIDRLAKLVSEAQAIARPKVLYKVAYIESRGDDYVLINGTRLDSRVLKVNLEGAHRVFVYAATCGTEVAEWAKPQQDMLQRFWADAICQVVLLQAIQAFRQHLTDRYKPGHMSFMNPGSLADWPIQQQRPLFQILGDTEAGIGVRLTEGLLMDPIKSSSGIYFPTEATFESCQLCPKLECPGRRAPYDQSLFERKYAQ